MKSNFLKTLLFGLIAASALQTQARGGSVGNGGDAVVCRNAAGQITSAELLDYYEVRSMENAPLKITGTREQALTQILEILSQTNTNRIDEYKLRINAFMSEAGFIANADLIDIPDSEHVFVPKNCKVEQLAIQKKPEDMIPGQKRYIINKDIWDKLAPVQQAGLIFHEIVFTDTLYTDSRYVRAFNGLVATNRLKDLSDKQLMDIFKHLGMNAIRRANYEITPTQDATFRLCTQGPAKLFAVEFEGCGFVTYYTSGKLGGLMTSRNYPFTLATIAPITQERINLEYTSAFNVISVDFYEDGKLKAIGPLRKPTHFYFKKYKQNVLCQAGEFVNLLPDGSLKSCSAGPFTYQQNNAFSQWTVSAQSPMLLSITNDGENFSYYEQEAVKTPLISGLSLIGNQWLKTIVQKTFADGKPHVVELLESAEYTMDQTKIKIPAGTVMQTGKDQGQLGATFNHKTNKIFPIILPDGQQIDLMSKNACANYIVILKNGNAISGAASKNGEIKVNGQIKKFKANDNLHIEILDGAVISFEIVSVKC